MAIGFSYLKSRIIVNLEGLTPTANYLLVGTGSAWTTTNSPTFAGLDLTGITNGYIPYISASGFANGPVFTDGTNVGIGTTAPQSFLHIAGVTNPGLRITDSTSGVGATDGLLIQMQDTKAYMMNFENGPLTFWTNGFNERMRIDENGKVGIGTVSPDTILDIEGTAPYLQLHNSTHEDSDGGRESRIIARGEQSGGEESVLGYMEFAHDGTSDDEKGLWRVLLNDGDDSDAPSITALTLVSSGKATLYGPLDCGADGASQGILTLWDGAGGNTPGNIKIHSPNGTAWYLFVEDDGTVKIHNAAPTQNSDGSAVGDQSD